MHNWLNKIVTQDNGLDKHQSGILVYIYTPGWLQSHPVEHIFWTLNFITDGRLLSMAYKSRNWPTVFPVELFFQAMRIEFVLYKNVLKSVIRNISVQANTNFPAIYSLLEF